MAGPLGAPRKGEPKWGGFKKKREEVMRQTGLVATCYPICTVVNDTSSTAYPSNKTPEEAKEKI